MPQRVPIGALVEAWNLSESRIRDFISQGRIERGPDGLFDFDACMAMRKAQIDKYQVRTLLQSYSKGGVITPPKILAHRAKTELTVDDILGVETVPELTLDDILGPDPVAPAPVEPPAATTTLAQTIDAAAARAQELHELRVGKAREDLERARVRREVEAGRYGDKAKIRKAAQKGGALMLSIFGALPSQIAAMYPDPEGKSEVRRKVEAAIDQAQHAYYSALKEAGCGVD